MQERADEHWRMMAKKNHEPKQIGDFGWRNPEPYAIEIGSAFAQFHILPEPGGYNNQYEDDWHDIATYMAGASRAAWEEYQDDNPAGTPSVEPGEYPDWAEYTR